MKQNPQKLTSVKVEEEVFNEFRIESYKLKFTLGKLVNRSMYLFLNDEDFKNKILNTNI